MKKFIFTLVSLFLLISCQQEDIYIVMPEVTYPVNFKLSAELTVGESPMRAEMHKLEYLVYNDQGEFVHSKNQVMNDTVAKITDDLAIGNYHIIMLVADNLKAADLYNKFDEDTHLANGETFYGKFDLTIKKGNNELLCVLKRLTGRVELVVDDLDLTPESTYRVEVELKNLPQSFNISTKASVYGEKINLLNKLTVKQWKESKIYFDALASTTDVKPLIEIRFYDQNEVLLKSKVTPDFDIKENTITRLKGKLFESSGLEVSLDQDWDGINEVPIL